jgi:guanylate kinase
MIPLPEKYRYIVIEGPVGAGKTSLARQLAERSGRSCRGFTRIAGAMRCRRSCSSCFNA